MNTKLSILIYPLLLIGFFSCSPPSTRKGLAEDTQLPALHMQEGAGQMLFSELIDSLRYVPLETLPHNLITEVDKITVTQHRIWVMDKAAATVWVFGKGGNFLFNFCQTGKGPGELLRLNTMIVAEKRNRVYLSDPGKSIQVFDTTGKFVEQIQSPFFFKEFERVGPNCFALYTMIDNTGALDDTALLAYNLLLVDSTFQHLQGKFFPYTQGLDDILAFNRFSKFGDQLLFNYSLYDTLYQITSSGPFPAWGLDFGQHAFHPKMLQNYGKEAIMSLDIHDKLIDKGVHFSINRFFHNQDYLILYTSVQTRMRIAVHHRNSNQTFYINQWQNDLTGINSVDLVGLFKNELYFVVPAYRLAEMESADAVALSQRVTPNDNAVLMIATLKVPPNKTSREAAEADKSSN
jgi:hypothetical protein